MKRLLQNLPFDLAFIALLWFGFYQDIEPAKYIALSLAWFVVGIAMLAMMAQDKIEAALREKGPRTWYFKVWDWGTEIVMWAMIAGAGYWVLGTFFAFAVVWKQGMTHKIDESFSQGQPHGL